MAKKREKKPKIKIDKYTLKEKVQICILVSFAASFIALIFNPIDIFANNFKELSFALKDFIFPLLGCFALCFLATFGILMIFNKHILNIVTAVGLSVFVSDYIYNLTIGKNIFVSGDVRITPEQSTIYFLIIACITAYIMILISLFTKNKWKNVCTFLCVLLIAMNSASLISDFASKKITSADNTKVEYALSEKNMLNVSGKENVVYFLFDRFDKAYYDEVVKQYPDYFSKTLDGFTFFDNSVSTFSRTYPAVAGLITGVNYDGKTDADEYFKNAYSSSPFLSDLKSNGYNVNLYVDRYYEYADAKYFKDVANNAEKINGYTPDQKEIMKYLLSLSYARILPYEMPVYMFHYTAEGKTLELSNLNSENEIYHDDDAAVYEKLNKNGLSTYDSDKNFTFIYLHGSHGPFTLNSDAKRVDSSTSFEQTVGSFKIIDKYISELKRLGVYDDTTIVITGDHGYPYTDTEPLLDYIENGTRTCMFVKPRNSQTKGLETRHTQASVADLIPTIVKDTNLQTNRNYGVGLFDIDENETRTRVYYHSRLSGNSKLILDEYNITGDAADKNNWKFIKSINTKQTWY